MFSFVVTGAPAVAGSGRRSILYSLIKLNSRKTVLQHELPSFIVALIIAQLFFKWGSFTLELVGFIATWYVLGFAINLLTRTTRKSNPQKLQ